MNQLEKRYRVTGFGIERLLNALRQKEISLRDIRRQDLHRVDFSVPARQGAAVEKAVQAMGFSIESLPSVGLMRRWERIKQRKLLFLALLISIAFMLAALQFLWRVEITGAGKYKGEINTYLQEEGIVPGVLKRSVDPRALSDGLLYRLPGITWARCSIQGTTLQIDITQEVSAPMENDPNAAGNIVASCDGIVESVSVFSGKAAVKPGDAVQAGDVLILGEERAQYDGATRPVHARGQVKARVWKSAEARVDAMETISTPTGREANAKRIATPWRGLTDEREPDYLTYDVQTERVPIVGAWLPLYLEKSRYIEVSLAVNPRPLEDALREAGVLAMRNLLSLCGKNDEIIDKWLIFSMIEGDTVQATATAEMIVDIGRFAAHISD